jgi:FixJ family two-component response regulator
VINLKDKQKIILEAVLEGKTQRQIARDMKISRSTVAKYFKNYEDSKSKLMGCDDVKIKEERIRKLKSCRAQKKDYKTSGQ